MKPVSGVGGSSCLRVPTVPLHRADGVTVCKLESELREQQDDCVLDTQYTKDPETEAVWQ